MYHIVVLRSSVNERLGRFHVLAIVNIAAMNIKMRVSFQSSVFLSFCFRSELRDHMVILYFNEISIVFCIVATSDYIPRTSIGEFSFCTPFPAFIICRLFGDGHSDW